MDRVTKSYLNDFCKKYDIEGKDYEKYEHFINYLVVEGFSYESFTIEDINVGANGTFGIDGFAIMINGNHINNKDDLEDIIQSNKSSEASVIFIQTKTSDKFKINDISNFGHGVKDLSSENPKIDWSEEVKEKIALFNTLIENTYRMKGKPKCFLYYVTAGRYRDNSDRNVIAKNIISEIDNENIYKSIELNFYGVDEVQDLYKRIGTSYKKTFEFPKQVLLPKVGESIPKSYLGIIPAKTLVDIITDENGDIIPQIFYDNVRDYQGGNKVNSEMANTLNSDNKNMFFAMNNGVTIISEKIHDSRDAVEIESFQIINGCQTSNVIFENRENLTDEVYVPIRLIETSEQDVMSKIIRATNRQTEVKEQDLIAFTDFQKNLEAYYGSIEQVHRLYYERRAKQFNKTNIERKRIVDKSMQIKAFSSYFYNKPDMATRYFGTLFSKFGDKLFIRDHTYCPYYMVAYLLYGLDESFRKRKIDKKYKKIKYFILMMMKYEFREILGIDKETSFGHKRFDNTYCEKILEYCYKDNNLDSLIISIISKSSKFDSFDFDDRDLGKSEALTRQCISIYQK